MVNLTLGSLFSGIGGFELAAELLNINTIWNCEIQSFQRQILKKNFPDAIQYEDIRELCNSPESIPSYVDIISGGFPCQDISVAREGEGINGSRSGLWKDMCRVVASIRPKYVVIENSSMLCSRGLDQVLYDLAQIGYDAEWQSLSLRTFGLQQRRERIYIIAYPNSIGSERSASQSIFREPYLQEQPIRVYPGWRERRDIPQPRTIGSTYDVPNLMDRNKSLGNSISPLAALYLFKCIILNEENNDKSK